VWQGGHRQRIQGNQGKVSEFHLELKMSGNFMNFFKVRENENELIAMLWKFAAYVKKIIARLINFFCTMHESGIIFTKNAEIIFRYLLVFENQDSTSVKMIGRCTMHESGIIFTKNAGIIFRYLLVFENQASASVKMIGRCTMHESGIIFTKKCGNYF